MTRARFILATVIACAFVVMAKKAQHARAEVAALRSGRIVDGPATPPPPEANEAGASSWQRELVALQERLRKLEEEYAAVIGKPEPNAGGPTNHTTHAQERLLADPRYVELTRVRLQPALHLRFAPLLQQLTLDPDTKAKLMDLLTDRLVAGDDSRSLDHPMSSLDWRLPRVMEQAGVAEVDAEIAKLLGPHHAALYERYLQVVERRDLVDVDIAGYVADAAPPLTETQRSTLAAILFDCGFLPEVEQYKKRFDDVRTGRADPETNLTAVDREIIAKASRVLDPRQLDQLRVYLSDRNLEARLIVEHGFPPYIGSLP